MKTALVLSLVAAAAALDRPIYGLDYDTRSSEYGGCKSDDAIRKDFRALKPVTSNVRIYSMNDGCVDRVLNIASEVNVRIWLGIWGNIEKGKDAFDKEFKNLQRLVKERRIRNDNVLGIHVASEALFRYYIQEKHDWAKEYDGVQKLFSYVNKVRDFLRANQLDLPVTIADVMDSYKAIPEIYDVVDVVSVNQFSQWEGVAAKDGVNLLFERMRDIQLAARKAGKPIVISETGWSANGTVDAIKEATPESSATFLHDFMRFTEQQNFAYYYFTSFNLPWGDNTAFGTIEKNFGLFDEKRNLLPHVKGVTLGKYHKPVRLWNQGKVIKVDGANTNTFGRVYLDTPASGLSDSMDNEIWFYDEEALTFRSRSTNQCLDTYEDDQGVSQVHVYWCEPQNGNQKWNFLPDGTFEVVSKASESAQTSEPQAPQAPVAPINKAECGTCNNCQYSNNAFSLCYANWTPQDCNRMGSTHRWCGDGAAPALPTFPTPTTTSPRLGDQLTDEKVQVGVFTASSNHAQGKCLHATDNSVEMIPCDSSSPSSVDTSFKFSVRPLDTEEITLSPLDSTWKLTEFYGRVTVSTEPILGARADTQIWFYDPLLQRIRNKANSKACLDLVENQVGGRVEGRPCDHTPSQTWSYNDLTGQIFHMHKLGLCLTAGKEHEEIHVNYCDLSNKAQKWTFDLIQLASQVEPLSETTGAPATETPEVTTTEAPTTEASTTEAPTTEAPTTEAPTTEAPTTEAPTTVAPTTEAPTTEAPTTVALTTEAPPTEAPTTPLPTDTQVSETTTPCPSGSPRPAPQFNVRAHLKYKIVSHKASSTPCPTL